MEAPAAAPPPPSAPKAGYFKSVGGLMKQVSSALPRVIRSIKNQFVNHVDQKFADCQEVHIGAFMYIHTADDHQIIKIFGNNDGIVEALQSVECQIVANLPVAAPAATADAAGPLPSLEIVKPDDRAGLDSLARNLLKEWWAYQYKDHPDESVRESKCIYRSVQANPTLLFDWWESKVGSVAFTSNAVKSREVAAAVVDHLIPLVLEKRTREAAQRDQLDEALARRHVSSASGSVSVGASEFTHIPSSATVYRANPTIVNVDIELPPPDKPLHLCTRSPLCNKEPGHVGSCNKQWRPSLPDAAVQLHAGTGEELGVDAENDQQMQEPEEEEEPPPQPLPPVPPPQQQSAQEHSGRHARQEAPGEIAKKVYRREKAVQKKSEGQARHGLMRTKTKNKGQRARKSKRIQQKRR